MHDLRTAIEEAYETKKVGKKKYEVYTRYKGKKGKGKSRKLILVDCPEEIFIITGAEGK
ncbi:MAG: hypothetical protein QMC78_03610 [Methanocellales archaeon]|nr:hypothetical protein [Methanocellales archaeon]